MALKAVVDTNVLISALIKKGSPPDQLLRRWLKGDFTIATCPAALVEIADVLNRSKIRAKYNLLNQDVDDFLYQFARQTQIVPGTAIAGIVQDPNDDMFVSTAIESQARYLISGDQRLLDLKRYQKVRIVTTRHFLTVLDRLDSWR